jgi:hypothetical protein
MKQLFTAIQKSIYGPEFYRELATKPLSYSWKYFSAFALIIVIFLTIVSSVPLVTKANKAVREFPQKFFAYYPDDFEFIITNGVLTTNATEAYIFPIPPSLLALAQKDGISTLAVFDTKTPFSLEQFNAYHTLVWVGGSQFVYRDKNTSVRVQQFDPKTNVTVNEGVLRKIESFVSPYYRLVGPLIVLVIFIGLFVALGFNFVYLLFGALFILVLFRVMKKEFTYGQCYQIGLHAMTLPVLVHLVLSITPLAFVGLPFTSTMIMLVVVYLNFRDDTLAPEVAPVSVEVKKS